MNPNNNGKWGMKTASTENVLEESKDKTTQEVFIYSLEATVSRESQV